MVQVAVVHVARHQTLAVLAIRQNQAALSTHRIDGNVDIPDGVWPPTRILMVDVAVVDIARHQALAVLLIRR